MDLCGASRIRANTKNSPAWRRPTVPDVAGFRDDSSVPGAAGLSKRSQVAIRCCHDKESPIYTLLEEQLSLGVYLGNNKACIVSPHDHRLTKKGGKGRECRHA